MHGIMATVLVEEVVEDFGMVAGFTLLGIILWYSPMRFLQGAADISVRIGAYVRKKYNDWMAMRVRLRVHTSQMERLQRSTEYNNMLTYVAILLMLPHSMTARGTGVRIETLAPERVCRPPVTETDLRFAYEHSGFMAMPGFTPGVCRMPLHGEILDICLHTVVGLDFIIGRGIMWKNNIVTSSHVGKYDKIRIGDQVYAEDGRDPVKDLVVYAGKGSKPVDLEPVVEGDVLYLAGRKPEGWMGWGTKYVLYQTEALSILEGVVYAQQPRSREGDTGLPAFVHKNGNFKLIGVTGKWSSTVKDFEIQHVANQSVVGSSRTVLTGDARDSFFSESIGMRPIPADHQGKRGTFEIHGGPCGSGKTQKCVAAKIRSEGDNYWYDLCRSTNTYSLLRSL